MMWGGIYGVKPDLGSLYDCSVATQDHVLGMPKDIGCNHKFEANKVRKYSAEVMQYDPMETDIKLYKCSVKKVILKCFEKLFGSDEKSRSTSAITFTSQQCRQAVKTKQSRYGPISLMGRGFWTTTSHQRYKCKWLEHKEVTVMVFTINVSWGTIVGRDDFVQQQLTHTTCMYSEKQCKPVEEPESVIIWGRNTQHSSSLYRSLGKFEVSQVHEYVVVASLSLRGSIITNENGSLLLDNGYIIKEHGEKANVSRKFKNFSEN